MSTILHPVQNHAWWYAAAAAVAITGFLAVLVVTVFSGASSTGGTTTNDHPITYQGHGKPYSSPCFAHRPGGSVELDQRGCPV